MNEPLDSRQLKAFVILAKTGSYTQTARQLSVTHSAISHSMRALESAAGCRLLSRMNKRVILTEAGEALLHHAWQVLEEMDRARATLNTLNKWGYWRLRLAAEPDLLDCFLTGVLAKFHHEFPRVLINFDRLNSGEARAAIEGNRADLALGEKSAADERFEFVALFADRFQVVVDRTHPWAAAGGIPRSELPQAPCILHRGLPESRRLLEAHLAGDSVALNTVAEIDSLETIKALLKQPPAFSLLPAWAVKREVAAGALVNLPFGRRPLLQTWGFSHWRGRALNHAEATFLKLCRSAVAALE